MEELLVCLSTFSIFGGTTTASANTVLSVLIFLSCLFLSCSESVLLGRKEGLHNKTLCSRFLKINSLLHCMDLSSRQHILEANETPWKQRGLLMAFSFSHKVFRTVRGLASILKNLSCDEILCLNAYSVHWESTLLSQLLFTLITIPKFVLKGEPFVIFLCPYLQKVSPDRYVVHLNMH